MNQAGRPEPHAPFVPSAEIAARFPDLHPPLSAQTAIVEANRCLFCFDAPCMQACPTHIDVPGFIRKIVTGNLAGSAKTILDANILGASCARVCPVEVLCEGACVMKHQDRQPIAIGLLQRHAMEAFEAADAPLPFGAGEDSGASVALIGAGPASLACAAELRRLGIAATLFDARPLPGGLNTYGVAEYKLPLIESLREIEMLRRLGVGFRFNTPVDADALKRLEQEHDAIFLGIGMGAIRPLGLPREDLPGVTNALDLIAGYKSGEITRVPRTVVVIGAGNTAIDAAIASVRLGASEVYMVYRRGREQMSAFSFEYEHARREGVRFLWNLEPAAIVGTSRVDAIELRPLASTGQPVTVACEMIVLSIGQAPHKDLPGELERDQGRIVIDPATGQTSRQGYFAGGDCTNGGREVVDAVADGKRAARGIATWLAARPEVRHA